MPDKLYAFQDKMTRFIDEGRAVDVISLDFLRLSKLLPLYPGWDVMVWAGTQLLE